jgi:undecaprenyl-diphosphatase
MTYSLSPRYSAVLAGVFLVVFAVVAAGVVTNATTGLDAAISGIFHNSADAPLGPDWLLESSRDITSLGSYALLTTMVIVASLVLLTIRRWQAAAYLVAVSISGTVLSTILKHGFDRPRPAFAAELKVFTASFPSGHAMMSAVVLLTLAAVVGALVQSRSLRRLVWIMAIILTVVVGISRIHLGVHYPTDVMGGWAIGAAWTLLCGLVADAMLRRRITP